MQMTEESKRDNIDGKALPSQVGGREGKHHN